MGESPRWHDGRFWMCDWRAGEVLAFDADANREVMARVEGLPFSIDWLDIHGAGPLQTVYEFKPGAGAPSGSSLSELAAPVQPAC